MRPVSEDGSIEDRISRSNLRTLRDLQEPPTAARGLTQLTSQSRGSQASGQSGQEDGVWETQSLTSEASSCGSDSSVTSAAGLLNRMCNCPEFEDMEFVVDPFCNELSLREVHLYIRRSKEMKDRAVPALCDWLWPDCKRKFRDFVQGRLNEVLTGQTKHSKTMPSLTFKLPNRSTKFGLVANSIEMTFYEDTKAEDEECSSGRSDEVPDIPDMTARIKCGAFMLKRMQASKPQLMKDMEQKARAKEDLVRANTIDGVLGRNTPSQTSNSSDEFPRLAPIQEGRRRPGSGVRSRKPVSSIS